MITKQVYIINGKEKRDSELSADSIQKIYEEFFNMNQRLQRLENAKVIFAESKDNADFIDWLKNLSKSEKYRIMFEGVD